MLVGAFLSLGDLYTLLGFTLTLLAFRFWWLTPSALIFLMLGDQGMVYCGLVATGWAILYSRQQKIYWSRRIAMILALLSLLAVIQAQQWLDTIALMVLPWSLWVVVQYGIARNSGGTAIWVPLMLSASYPALHGQNLGISGGVACLFFAMVAWYRQLPQHNLWASLWMSAGLLLALFFESVPWALLVLTMMSFQVLDKKCWGNGHCALKIWAWLGGVLILATLVVTPQVQTSLVQMLLLFALVWLGQQETCRLCVSVARCREAVVSLMGARSALIFAVGTILLGYDERAWFITCWILLMAEAARFASLRPVTEAEILDSPCKGRWVQWILEGLKKN
jgi:hypothetical protein